MSAAGLSPAPPSVRSIALPVEHGGWGLLGEPLLLGLVLAPSRAGFGLALASLAAFLARHPLKLALADRRRGTRYPRTALAERFAAGYGLLGLAGLALAWDVAGLAWVPLVVAAPGAFVQLWYDARHRGRQLAPELLGSAALGSSAAAILLAGGWPVALALGAWALLAVKAVASVLYVRTRFRLDRGQAPARAPALGVHLAGTALAVGLALAGAGPWLGVAALLVLTGRALQGLSARRASLEPRQLGFRELAFGAVTIALFALGYGLHL